MPIACSGRTVLPAKFAASMIEKTGSDSRSPLRLLVRGGKGILNPLENEMSALAK
jgi:hypothetical protein